MVTNTEFLNINNEKDFLNIAIKTFEKQFKENEVYNEWCRLMNVKQINTLSDIPFLPISFFKTKKVTCSDEGFEDYFLSSGTGNMSRSTHYVFNKQMYLNNTINCFEQFYDKVESYCYICLLPNYLEQEHSSLICMMDNFVRKSKFSQSGFFKNELNQVLDILIDNQRNNVKTILFGVTYALLDLVEEKKSKNIADVLDRCIVFETGGMKGRRKEISKQELHSVLKQGLGVKDIASEYGMCELFSQAYSKSGGKFFPPKQMQVFIKPVNDPKGENIINHNGVINIIDLANQDSCAFIQTEDIGRKYSDGSFEIVGRLNHSALRGCNLMYEN